MNKTAFCITGWHYPEKFFRQIASITDVDYFVVSHKRRSLIPDFVFNIVSEDRILFRPNYGYDWGCYQQFLTSGFWREYETIFFMHDDIEIHDTGFVKATLDMLEHHAVVGNGVGPGSVSYTGVNKHPYAYAHSRWKPETFTFSHYTVRGSYFATRRDVLDALGSFEVYWDLMALNIGFGNWSTKSSCGKLESLYGPDCFGFLSDDFGRSEYITEFYRGDVQATGSEVVGVKKDLYDFLKRISIIYLEIYYRKRKMRFRTLWLLAMKVFLGLFSGRFY
jgi:hypothetical protein